jgi:predicted GTPase
MEYPEEAARLERDTLKEVFPTDSPKCKRFRILVIGRSGVGKSTVISRVFDVDDSEVSFIIRLSELT